MNFLTRLLWPLKSRKIQTAVATVILAYLAQWGLEVPEEVVMSILGVGVAVILGIAHEDAGEKSGALKLIPTTKPSAKKSRKKKKAT